VVDKTELVIRILKKFEPDDSLIHTFVKNSSKIVKNSGELLFELPRYDLCFELSSDNQQLWSKNLIGFSLTARLSSSRRSTASSSISYLSRASRRSSLFRGATW
jgi:hypothetical protein